MLYEFKQKRNEMSYEDSYDNLLISNKLQTRWFVTRISGWEEMGLEIKEEENGFREKIIRRVFLVF